MMIEGDSSEVPPASEEQSLIEALRRGEESAFVILLDRYQPALVRLATVYVRDRGTGAAPSRVCSQGGLARWSAPTPVGSCAGDLRGVTVAHVARTTSVSPSLRALT